MILALVIISAMLITGCTQQGTGTTNTTPVATSVTHAATPVSTTPAAGGNQSQIANPASVNCINKGGTLDIRKNADGSEYGVCTINGSECEEWAFFRGECVPGGAKANATVNATPAATSTASNVSVNATGNATLNATQNATLNATGNVTGNATLPLNATAVNGTKANATS